MHAHAHTANKQTHKDTQTFQTTERMALLLNNEREKTYVIVVILTNNTTTKIYSLIIYRMDKIPTT